MIDSRTVSNASTFSSGQKYNSIVLFAEMHYSYNAKIIQHAHALITVVITAHHLAFTYRFVYM